MKGNEKAFRKLCPACHEEFETDCRHQVYCDLCRDNGKAKLHSAAKQKRRVRDRASYEVKRDYMLMKQGSRKLARLVLKVEGRDDECEYCHAVNVPFEVHHTNGLLDNRPYMLRNACERCHRGVKRVGEDDVPMEQRAH